ncbi:MAG: efflux RND transporter periplasmic adaptor subunit [Burkholderiales bacterium]
MAKVESKSLAPSVFGVGSVEARYAYTIGPTVAGRVARVHVDHGDAVAVGQLLAEIDPVDLHERLASAAFALERAGEATSIAEAQLREATSRHRAASANAVRYRDLAQRNFVSQELVANRENDANVTQAAVDAAEASVRAAGRDVARVAQDRGAITKQLANLRLVSPVAGVIVARAAEPGSTVVAGQAVLRIIDPRSLWVQARIDQARAGEIVTGQRVEIRLRAAPKAPLAGRVARIELQSDVVTEERIIDIELLARPQQLVLGELAEITVLLSPVPAALVVPAAAIKSVAGVLGVWQTDGGRAAFRPVTVGVRTLEGEAQILSGLVVGDTVIVHSGAPLEAGDRVRIDSSR